VKRRQSPTDVDAGIPPQLFYGIARGAFRFYGDDPRSIEQSGRRHRWADEVRRHGYTVLSLREAAETDAGYQEWLAWQERKARVTAQGPSA
jgi:hypothetical protein